MSEKFIKRKIFVAMSGGVDSSVAALLLKRAGYDVTGVYIQGWSDREDIQKGYCTTETDRRDALKVCVQLKIPFLTFHFEKEYKKYVIDYFFQGYAKAKTPNPDVMCNRYIKFDLFLKKAISMGAEFIATGHYARVKESAVARGKQRFRLFIPKDKRKDQTYFLYQLKQKALRYCLFPLADYQKNEVRQIARAACLPTAQKRESQGLCFVGQVPLHEFLQKRFPGRKGSVLNTQGKVIGEHSGAYFYTIGQRHGFHVFNKTTQSAPYYIVFKDVKRNVIVVAYGRRAKELFKTQIIVKQMHWVAGLAPQFPLQCKARIRHGQALQSVRVVREGTGRRGYRIHFQRRQFGVAEGQSLVLYQRGEVLGGGIIEKTFP